MKLISVAIISAILAYSAGVEIEQENRQETIKAVSEVALSFGYVCGAFRDPACLNSFQK